MSSRRVPVALALGSCALYCALLRRPILTWGASEAEAVSRLPGDELLENADDVSTRAIEIDAPASAVWPWLAQMGPSPRGGAYTYDWIENLLGLNMHSADGVLPEFQHPEIGETIGFGSNRMRLERIEPEHLLTWRSEDGNWVWTFVLRSDNGTTRLISRNRFRLPTLASRIGMLPMETGSLVMERKMLLGIKQRAERLASAGRERIHHQETRPKHPYGTERSLRPDGDVRVLVAYASRYGSTRGVAERIARTLAQSGNHVELQPADQVADASAYDAVVVGSPVFNQRWLPEAEQFVQRGQEALAARPVWLFSVGTFGDRKRFIGPMMKREPKGIADIQQAIGPRDYRVFAGVIDRHQWPYLSRLFFYALGGRLGDNRDWADIDSWASQIARSLLAQTALPGPSPFARSDSESARRAPVGDR
jgi:menaquinone-dependent protoporphyrinogen IX oxidase